MARIIFLFIVTQLSLWLPAEAQYTSYFMITGATGTHFLVTFPDSSKTGFDASESQFLEYKEKEGAFYTGFVENEEGGLTSPEFEYATLALEDGIYMVEILGVEKGVSLAHISFSAKSTSDNSVRAPELNYVWEGITKPNHVSTLLLTVDTSILDADPKSSDWIALRKVTNLPIIQEEVQMMLHQGWITQTEFEHIQAHLSAYEAARDLADTHGAIAAINELNAFLDANQDTLNSISNGIYGAAPYKILKENVAEILIDINSQ